MKILLPYVLPERAIHGELRLFDFPMVLPAGAEILSVTPRVINDDDLAHIHALIDTRQTETEKRIFVTISLGQHIDTQRALRFIGMISRKSRTPLHLFEVGR